MGSLSAIWRQARTVSIKLKTHPMKKFYSIILALVFASAISAQNLLTVREVFDFSIGDKFQLSGNVPGQPPNRDRITIVGKYYSIGSDTLFYLRSHDSYYTTMLLEPPYLKYHFWTKTDTICYTHLDLSISDLWISYDSSMYIYDTINFISGDYCDSIINGCHIERNTFEPDIYISHFGKGLGLVKNYYFSASFLPNNVVWNDELMYYQKNGINCGNIDTTAALSIHENLKKDEIIISPNPADSYFNIDLIAFESIAMKIYNSTGQLLDSKIIYRNSNYYNCSSFRTGVYFICFTNGTRNYYRKLMIK